MITDEIKADAIILSKRPLVHLKEVLATRTSHTSNTNNKSRYDIEDMCDIETLKYAIKHYALLSPIATDWYLLSQNVLESLPE